MRRLRVCVPCAALLVLACSAPAAAAIPEAEVFRQAFASPAGMPAYLRAHAGEVIAGTGRLEAVMPRATSDSSVPDSNHALAIIHLQHGRKVTCGLPQALTREAYGRFHEGAPVAFQGELVDAQDWGEWKTLYLSGCALTLEE